MIGEREMTGWEVMIGTMIGTDMTGIVGTIAIANTESLTPAPEVLPVETSAEKRGIVMITEGTETGDRDSRRSPDRKRNYHSDARRYDWNNPFRSLLTACSPHYLSLSTYILAPHLEFLNLCLIVYALPPMPPLLSFLSLSLSLP